MSIRTKLAAAVAIVLVATIALLGVVFVRSTRDTLVDQIDEQVLDSAARWKGPPPNGYQDYGGNGNYDYGGGGGDKQYLDQTYESAAVATDSELFARPIALLVYSQTGELLEDELCGFPDDPKSPPRLPTIPSPEIETLVNRIVTTPAVDGSLDYRTLVRREDDTGKLVVTAAPLDTVDDAVAQLVQTLLIVGAGALAAATLASWWLIRRGMRPVDHMVDTAAAIAAGDLSRRVPDANPRSELGRLGGALNEMLGQIEQSIQERAANEQRLRRFVADAAHELRTPLTSVRGYAELYRQGAIADAAGVAKAMGRIEAEGSRMARLVDDLLLLARLDRQRGLETEPIPVVAVVRDAIADFKAVDPDRPLTEQLDGEATVLGDRVRLRQIVDNLLANARTHTPPGTPVHITTRRTPTHVEIDVADEGPGIPLDDQERVFERFWRADPSRVRRTGGTGLGLAIVASLVAAHGGAVTLTSPPGHGATFTVRLPLAPESP